MASKTYLLNIDGRDYKVKATEIADISTVVTGITPTTATYTGEPIVVSVISSTPLTIDEDYQIDYSDNISVGACTVTISGIGAYEGVVEYTLTIEAAP